MPPSALQAARDLVAGWGEFRRGAAELAAVGGEDRLRDLADRLRRMDLPSAFRAGIEGIRGRLENVRESARAWLD